MYGFVIRTVDEHVVHGRTLVFAQDPGSIPVVVEAGKTPSAPPPHVERMSLSPFDLQKAAAARIDLY
ncbi:hypothetical protein [Burkholderia sp. BCC0405]|uniref:hypothetical protein n=1 Tax=Burkholderia sp. BCC0405 TaxID=2676298 RepID=UPI00158E402D|nr:hypothetical protein [Burkholderia sp. BCC0405]